MLLPHTAQSGDPDEEVTTFRAEIWGSDSVQKPRAAGRTCSGPGAGACSCVLGEEEEVRPEGKGPSVVGLQGYH